MIIKFLFKKCIVFRDTSGVIRPSLRALGIERGRIRNNQITASSNWNHYHGAFLARLNRRARGRYQGGWSARHNNRYQYLQVNITENQDKLGFFLSFLVTHLKHPFFLCFRWHSVDQRRSLLWQPKGVRMLPNGWTNTTFPTVLMGYTMYLIRQEELWR